MISHHKLGDLILDPSVMGSLLPVLYYHPLKVTKGYSLGGIVGEPMF